MGLLKMIGLDDNSMKLFVWSPMRDRFVVIMNDMIPEYITEYIINCWGGFIQARSLDFRFFKLPRDYLEKPFNV